MEGGRRQVVQFTAHKRRGGSSFASNPAPSKKPNTEPKADPKIDAVAEKVSIPSKVKESPAASSKIPGDSTAESVNRGHYGNLAYRSYTAKDYKKTIEYAEKQIAEGPKKYESLILRANALKKLGSIDLAIRDCLACLSITRTHPAPYILAIQCYVAKKDFSSAYNLATAAVQSASQAHPMYKKLVSYRTELQSQCLKKPSLPQIESASQTWLKTLPLELLLSILKPLPLSSILVMAQTCRSWRSVLVRIPELWAHIGLDFSASHPAKDKNKRQHAELILQAFLSRANTRLRAITLAHCPKLDWKWFSALRQFPRPLLNRLEITNTVVSAPFLKPALGAFGAQLTHLVLASCKLDDDAVALLLSACPSLTHLDISGKGVPSSELLSTARGDLRREYPSLQWLGLEETDVGHDFLALLGKVFPSLKGINLNRVGAFKARLLPELCECLPKLTEISLRKMGYVFEDRLLAPAWFEFFGATYATLTHLNLSQNHFVNDQMLASLVASADSLRVLDLSYTSIGKTGLGMVMNCPRLESLSLSSCAQVTDSAMVAFADALCISQRTLGTLDLSGLKLENATFGVLARAVGGFIRDLNLSSTPVSSFGLQYWMVAPPTRLDHLRVNNCTMVATEFVAKLRALLPRTRIYHSIPY